MEKLAECCQAEAQRNLRRHRAVAVCDGCGSLLMAYGNDLDYERTVEELTENDVPFRVGFRGGLRVIAKGR